MRSKDHLGTITQSLVQCLLLFDKENLTALETALAKPEEEARKTMEETKTHQFMQKVLRQYEMFQDTTSSQIYALFEHALLQVNSKPVRLIVDQFKRVMEESSGVFDKAKFVTPFKFKDGIETDQDSRHFVRMMGQSDSRKQSNATERANDIQMD